MEKRSKSDNTLLNAVETTGEGDSYGSGWIRPSRLMKNRSSGDENNFGIKAMSFLRQRTSTSFSSVSNVVKRNRSCIEIDFQSPNKKTKRCFPVSPIERYNSNTSPDSRSLVHRMTTRESDREDSPGSNVNSSSPLSSYLPSFRAEITPTRLQFGLRQSLRPAPAPVSPSSYLLNSPTFSKTSVDGKKRIIPRKLDETIENVWKKHLCLDWSLKTSLRIESAFPFGWTSTHLKASEESSGTSAFARCIDITPASVPGHGIHVEGEKIPCSQLDTSLGAQFHAACLYWQHPYIPSINLFPRLGNTESLNMLSSTGRLNDKILNYMQTEWVEAFRSSFQLLRSRQCPFFYICAPLFTALFTAAGTQGDERTQIYINPSTKGLREALKNEGIKFSMPYWSVSSEIESPEDGDTAPGTDGLTTEDPVKITKKGESDDETDKWLDDMGISQDVTLTSFRGNTSGQEDSENTKKSLLVIVGGSDSLLFFNFLLNAKQFLVTSGGSSQGGIPPTILSPNAFHGATLRTLKVKQGGRNGEMGKLKHNIELSGPILPQVIHQLCSLLSSTVECYTIQISTLKHTIPLNLYANVKLPLDKIRPSAFELQNLSDCGLRPNILEAFCKCDNCDTMGSRLDCKGLLFRWS